MPVPLEPKLAELLIRLVELDDGSYETFHPHFPGDGPPREANLLNHRDETIPEGATKELADRGYLDMEPHSGKRLGKFRISESGRSLAAQLAVVGDDSIDLSWSAVEPVLIQIHRVWLSEGAPPLGIPGAMIAGNLQPQPDAAQFSAILHELQRGDWIEYRPNFGPPLPQGVRPTSRTIAYLEGWPTHDAQALGQQFVMRLEEAIEAEPDAEKQSKLRDALTAGGSALRDVAVEVAGATLARSMGA
jgi:hypothetical protein